jgi:hypothetical protein
MKVNRQLRSSVTKESEIFARMLSLTARRSAALRFARTSKNANSNADPEVMERRIVVSIARGLDVKTTTPGAVRWRRAGRIQGVQRWVSIF